MSKRKKPRSDRLSELHDSLIFCIFEFLPTRDVVRTTVLSKRWKDLWKTVPWLNFVDTRKEIDPKKDRSLVDGAVESWRGLKLEKFNVHLVSKFESSFVKKWLDFAVEKKVENLAVSLPFNYPAPQSLYRCSSLKKLSLTNCPIRDNVHWDQLKKLKINGAAINQEMFNKVLKGSPKLEELFLVVSNGYINLSINSTSLKKLSIYKYHYTNPSIGTDMIIVAPNLKTLVISGAPYSNVLLTNVVSLTEAFLEINDRYSRSKNNDISWTSFAREALIKILPTIKHVESLTLWDRCIKALGDVKGKGKVTSLPNAKFLRLKNWSQECIQVLGAIEICPNLRDLVLETTYHSPGIKDVGSWVKFERKKFPKLFLHQVRTVDVTWRKGDDSVFPLIQILLKYAKNLEKMVFRMKKTEPYTPWKSKVMISQKLLRMQRSSSMAQLILC